MPKLTIVLFALLMVGAIACGNTVEEVEDPMVWTEPNAIASLGDYLYEQNREIFEIAIQASGSSLLFGGANQRGNLVRFPPTHPATGSWTAAPHVGDSWTVTTASEIWRVYEGGQRPILVGQLPTSDS